MKQHKFFERYVNNDLNVLAQQLVEAYDRIEKAEVPGVTPERKINWAESGSISTQLDGLGVRCRLVAENDRERRRLQADAPRRVLQTGDAPAPGGEGAAEGGEVRAGCVPTQFQFPTALMPSPVSLSLRPPPAWPPLVA